MSLTRRRALPLCFAGVLVSQNGDMQVIERYEIFELDADALP